MCNCKKQLEEKLLDSFVKKNPEAKDHSVRLCGYTLVIAEEGLIQKGCMQFETVASYPLKKGGYKEKTSKSNFIFSYCPFCGKPEGGAA